MTGSATLDALFAAVADPTRRSLLARLRRSGPQSATRLVDGTSVTRQAIVKHLQVLADAGLVNATRAGREVLYAARPEALTAGVAWLVETGAAWDRRLDRLRRHVER